MFDEQEQHICMAHSYPILLVAVIADMPAKYILKMSRIASANAPRLDTASWYVATAKSSVPLVLPLFSINKATFGIAKSRASKYAVPVIALQTQVPTIPMGARKKGESLDFLTIIPSHRHLSKVYLPARLAPLVSSAIWAPAWILQ